MSGEVRSDGWWQASDGRWYPPEAHPDYVPPSPPPAPEPPTGAPPPPPATAPEPPGVPGPAVVPEPPSFAPPPAPPGPSFGAPPDPASSVYAPAPPPPGAEFPPTERTPVVDPTQQTVIGAVPPPTPGAVPPGVPPLAPPGAAGPPDAWPTPPQSSGPSTRAWYQRPVTYVIGGVAAAALVAGGLLALLGGGDDDGDDTATDTEPTAVTEPTAEAEPTAPTEPTAEAEPTVDPATLPTATPLATPTTAAEPTATPVPAAPPADPDEPAPDPDAIIQFVSGEFVETDFGTDWIMVLENTSTELAASTLFVNVEALGADGATVATSFASTSYLAPGAQVTLVGTFFDPDAPVADFSADWEWFENPPDPSLGATFTLGEAQVTSDEFTAEITVPVSHDGTTDRQLVQVNAAFYRGGNLVGTELTFVDIPVGATANAEFVLFGALVEQGWDSVEFAVVP